MESLDKNGILQKMTVTNRERISALEILDIIDSTNTYLLELSKNNNCSGIVCIANEQTAGRGRRGKSWYTAAGNSINCSLLWRFKNNSNLNGFSLAIGVMVVNALNQYGVPSGLQLKWPNDILFNGRKLGGILIESPQKNTLVMGIGLNLDFPAVIRHEVNQDWISLKEITPFPIQRNQLIAILLDEIISKISTYSSLNPFLTHWRQYDAFKNKFVMMQTQKEIIKGYAKGITEEGQFVVCSENGKLNFFSEGEINFAREEVSEGSN